MLESLQDTISGLEFEDVLNTGIFYYTLTFLIVGGLLLIVTLYRMVRLYREAFREQQSHGKKVGIVLLSTYFIIQLYLTIAIVIPYLEMVLSRMNEVSFWFPFNVLYEYSLRLHDTILFQLTGYVLIAGFILVSIVFLLSGLAKLLSSKPSRFQGGDNLMLALLISYVPVILFLGILP